MFSTLFGGSVFSREDGLLECPEGYEIRVPKSEVKLTRQNGKTCSAAKTDDKKSYGGDDCHVATELLAFQNSICYYSARSLNVTIFEN